MTKSNPATPSARRFSARGGILLLALGSLLLGACSNGGPAHRRDSDGKPIPSARELDPAATLYSGTMERAADGDCSDDTVAVLTCYASRGHGYEGAQTALGSCQIQNKNISEGITWLNRAANSGWPDAQKALTDVYLGGEGVAANKVEAGKWAQLYRRNPSLLSLGVQPDKKVAERVRAELTQAERIEASQRADQWNASFWAPDTALDAQAASVCYVTPRRRYEKPELQTPDVF